MYYILPEGLKIESNEPVYCTVYSVHLYSVHCTMYTYMCCYYESYELICSTCLYVDELYIDGQVLIPFF